MMKKIFYLNKGWKFTLGNTDSIQSKTPETFKKITRWLKAKVPGTVHTDLLTNRVIPEPFYSDNEIHLQWIGETDWIYKTKFDFPVDFEKNNPIEIVFEGIDTISEIKLNGTSLGYTENMFRRYSFDVSSVLKEKGNSLEINFTSAVNYAREQEVQYGKLPVELRSERVYIRKAQYSFGWDWGPTFITAGIWRPVYLVQKEECTINKILFSTLEVTTDLAVVEVKAELSEKAKPGYKIKINLEDNGNSREAITEVSDKKNILNKLEIKSPKLWWPNGYGEAHLYNLIVQLLDDENKIIDEEKRKVGIRTLDLKLEENGEPTFQFIINGKPVFAKGANWIPADSFLPRVDESKYQTLLQLAKGSNMNIVRVWGGGIYENDQFYEICDELGLMVWQDFMFACASYPAHQEFLENIDIEVKENVLRLQYHPSIIIWCGNNENEWIWYQKEKRPVKEMPGHKIFHELIHGITKEIDPFRPYWQSSPFSFENDPNSPVSGNRHQWEIWSMWKDYKKVKDDKSLFVTEFGFQSPANVETIKSILPMEERKIQSRIFEFHNKQVEGPERLFRFLSAHLSVKTDFDDFIYLAQLNHGLAMRECLEHWRFRFPETNGSIIWQLNDCWPVSSWSLIDSESHPKLPYYFVKNSFAPQICGLFRNDNEIYVVVINNSLEEFEGNLQLDLIHIPSGKVDKLESKMLKVGPLQKNIIISIPITNSLETGKAILISTLKGNNKILHRNFYSIQEFKYLKLPKIKINLRKKKNEISISTDKPAFFIYLLSPVGIFEEYLSILLPGENIKMEVDSVRIRKINIKCLNYYFS